MCVGFIDIKGIKLLIYDFFFSEISPSRHIACELCDKSVHGGYDPIMNQV